MQEVVGVALLREGRVLAARRSGPPALAGLWEFPGGKVEPGEEPRATAVREIAEELRCTVEVTGWVDAGRRRPRAPSGFVLSVATARLVDGDPVPTEHDAVRWLRADQLDEVSGQRPTCRSSTRSGSCSTRADADGHCPCPDNAERALSLLEHRPGAVPAHSTPIGQPPDAPRGSTDPENCSTRRPASAAPLDGRTVAADP